MPPPRTPDLYHPIYLSPPPSGLLLLPVHRHLHPFALLPPPPSFSKLPPPSPDPASFISLWMATAAVVGLAAGKRPMGSSFFSYDFPEKLPAEPLYPALLFVLAMKDPKERRTMRRQFNWQPQAIRDFTSTAEPLIPSDKEADTLEEEEEEEAEARDLVPDPSPETTLMLRKTVLQKQWNLSHDPAEGEVDLGGIDVVRTGTSARERRRRSRGDSPRKRKKRPSMDRELARRVPHGYLEGQVKDVRFSGKEVASLSEKIKFGFSLEVLRERLKVKLGCEPSNKQLASSLRISSAELQSKFMESSLARDTVVLGHVGLVISIAQKYDKMGAEMADLIQGGMMGLLQGLKRFDSSKGCRISTYVYWWIRLGVSKALHADTGALRLSSSLHARLFSIRMAKAKLEEEGITPSIDKIAEILDISQRKVWNATKADCKVIYSLDREVSPSLNGLPTEFFRSYAADNRCENDPWVAFKSQSLKDEVHRLLDTTLNEREREIMRLYHGLKNESLTWEDIGRRLGLSRERVRKVGLAAMDKLKHAARERKLEAMLVEQ